MQGESLLVIIAVGVIAGWLAGQLVQRHSRHRRGLSTTSSSASSAPSSAEWLLPQLNIHLGAGIIAAIINATIGAVLLAHRPSTRSRRRPLGQPLGLAPVGRVADCVSHRRRLVRATGRGAGDGLTDSDQRSLKALVLARPPPAATSASRASAGSDFDPVRFMIDARWFSTVRWLMPRSAAMFLLGWPASTRSITSRCRDVRPARWVAADSRHSCNLLEFLRQFERPLDAGDQFLAADRLFDEIQARPPSSPRPPSARRCCR